MGWRWALLTEQSETLKVLRGPCHLPWECGVLHCQLTIQKFMTWENCRSFISEIPLSAFSFGFSHLVPKHPGRMHMGPKERFSLHPAKWYWQKSCLFLPHAWQKTSHCHYTFMLSLQILCRKQSGIFHQLEKWGPLDLIPINVVCHKVFNSIPCWFFVITEPILKLPPMPHLSQCTGLPS